MAKVIAPFLNKGTIDELNFVVAAYGKNYVRLKSTSGITSDEFKNNVNTTTSEITELNLVNVRKNRRFSDNWPLSLMI